MHVRSNVARRGFWPAPSGWYVTSAEEGDILLLEKIL
jgi:hypothetical protein